MTNELLLILENEIRGEFHIPPFFDSENLQRLIKQSDAFLNLLVSNIDYDVDLIARDLLKNRVFYAFNNRVNQFDIDFAYSILTWQFSYIKGVSDDTEL